MHTLYNHNDSEMFVLHAPTPQLACHHLRALQDTSLPHVPFALVQGPPGTGKTHTVHGILNVWHLTHYVRYHHRLQDRITNTVRQHAQRPYQLPGSGDDVVMLTSDVRSWVLHTLAVHTARKKHLPKNKLLKICTPTQQYVHPRSNMLTNNSIINRFSAHGSL